MKRVLTYLLGFKHSVPIEASFLQSLVCLFHEKTDDINEARVGCTLTDDRLILSSRCHEKANYILRCASYCPIKHITNQQSNQIPENVKSSGIAVAVVILLESRDNFVLLTKRSKNMRTFPNVWVPPGGHINVGEILEEAGLRELKEETGIVVQPVSKCDKPKIVGLWESAFPPMLLEEETLSRHHVVVYFQVKDGRTAEEINLTISLDESEVEMSAWVCCHLASDIVLSDQQFSYKPLDCFYDSVSNQCCSHKRDTWSDFQSPGASTCDGKTVLGLVNVGAMLNSYCTDNKYVERVSTGTKFALKCWLEEGSHLI